MASCDPPQVGIAPSDPYRFRLSSALVERYFGADHELQQYSGRYEAVGQAVGQEDTSYIKLLPKVLRRLQT